MRVGLKLLWGRILRLLRLTPLSLAEKCRIAFGTAVALILVLALSIPYAWMGQLTKKAALDAGRAKAEVLFSQHFQVTKTGEIITGTVNNTAAADANDSSICWIHFTSQGEEQLRQLPNRQREIVEFLKYEKTRDDNILLDKHDGVLQSEYVKIFRKADSFEPIAAVIIQMPAGEISQTVFMNRIWIIVAGLVAGAGAIVAFYMITQRVILRPIRQLRAIANNVAEGNLDIRSAIKTGDEYEKLAEAFNHMLDGLQADSRSCARQINSSMTK